MSKRLVCLCLCLAIPAGLVTLSGCQENTAPAGANLKNVPPPPTEITPPPKVEGKKAKTSGAEAPL